MSVQKCNCNHDYQDKKYGEGMRVHNKDKNGKEHCTVCGRGASSENRLKANSKNWHKGCVN